MPTPVPRLKRAALAIAVAGSLAAVTAFGVDPLDVAGPAEPGTITEPLVLSPEVAEHTDSYLHNELIRRGDTLAIVLARAGANDPEFLRYAAQDATARRALGLRPGRSLRIELDSLGRVQRLAYRSTGFDDTPRAAQAARRLLIARTASGFVAREESVPIERLTEMRSAEIRTSLFAATDGAGIPESVAIQLAEIFGGDIDMQRELRRGDRLRVVYDILRETDSFDAPVATRVVAAEFVNAGKTHRAVWYERNGKGEYYDGEGRSLKKAFLRNPLEFSRVTSGFSPARLHPIMRDWRAHRGVDFGAPIGTRVRAAADGVVEFAGQQRGYGNVIIIRHANEKKTLYAHLNEFYAGIRKGARVDQGDIIGTVGMTGWTSGPHLHFELHVGGEHVDPLKFAGVDAGRPLEPADRALFAKALEGLRHRLALADSLRSASFQ
jgi:murein DD-endopeptidase MepM/ murein hydrolase activator NlpD